MLEQRSRCQEELFVYTPLSELIPEDYILKRVDRALDLSWLREEVEPLYCADNGRPGIDPAAALRLMLAGFFLGIVRDRRLLREARMHLGIRWFAGYALHEQLPDHSSLSRIRERWGAQCFKRIFQRVVTQCVEAGLVSGETVHVDATLIRADVSWQSLTERHAEQVLAMNTEETQPGREGDASPGNRNKRGRPRTRTPKMKKRSTTDPDCSLTTSTKDVKMQPSYKQHTAADSQAGVIVDVAVTTGEASEGKQLIAQLERVRRNTGLKPATVTADAGYAHGANLARLEADGVEAIIPAPSQVRLKQKTFPLQRFKYDAQHDLFKCPGGKKLLPGSRYPTGRFYRAKLRDCRQCPLKKNCLSPSARIRSLSVSRGYAQLLRLRRRQLNPDPRWAALYKKHRWMIEGKHAEAKTQHGLSRAVRRGLDNVAIQCYLTAAAMNLKRLAALLSRFWRYASNATIHNAADKKWKFILLSIVRKQIAAQT